jgi:hypothetical protein
MFPTYKKRTVWGDGNATYQDLIIVFCIPVSNYYTAPHTYEQIVSAKIEKEQLG